ncbi:MAG: 6-phospho-beta-glucosidase [Elusimicrobia bacterium]|nr:6-phospho-beta-glucosidase [Elusimicrobiota bacterium]
MKKGISVCVVGAGSSYTPVLIEGILAQSPEKLPITSIQFTDIDTKRLGLMTGLSERMIKQSGRNIALKSDVNLEKMLEGSDFVITQIRVGGMDARHLDESIPLKYGIIGQETTGPGGMFKALRTIPYMIEIANKVQRIVPDAFILNYTNPSGIITESVTNYTKAKFIGLCSGIPGMIKDIKEEFKEKYPDLKAYSVGLNHLGFIYKIISNGKDVINEIIDEQCRKDKTNSLDIKLSRIFRAIPISYLNYYYHHDHYFKKLKSSELTRAQTIKLLEQEVFKDAADINISHKPEVLKKRGGGGYAFVTFSCMSAIYNNTGEELVMSTQNKGCVEGIDDNSVVEIACKLTSKGAKPIKVGEIPIAFRGLIQAVKTYETLTVEAAVKKSKAIALQALVSHPLVGDLDIAEPLLEEMLKAHKLEYK